MENNSKRVKKVANTLYNAYLERIDEYDRQIAELKLEEERVLKPFKERIEIIERDGGEKTQELDAKINELNQQIQEQRQHFEEAKKLAISPTSEIEAEMAKTKTQSQAMLKKPAIAKRGAIAAIVGAASAAAAHMWRNNEIAEKGSEAAFLENAAFPRQVVDNIKHEVEYYNANIKGTEQDIEIFGKIYGNIDMETLTPSNYLESIERALMNASVKVDGQDVIIVDDFGVSTEESVDVIMENVREMMFDGYSTYQSEVAASIPNLTPLAAVLGFGITMSTVYFQCIKAKIQRRSMRKQMAKIEKENFLKIGEIYKEECAVISALTAERDNLVSERDSVKKNEVERLAFEVNVESDIACKNINLNIERFKIMKDIEYIEYLRQMAEEGFDIAASRGSAKIIKIGKPSSYIEEKQTLLERLDKVSAKIDTQKTPIASKNEFMA